jgi:hypothetical protein
MIGIIATLLQLQPIITAHNQWLRLAPFFTGLRVCSRLLWLSWFWFTNRSLLQLPLSAGQHSTAEHTITELWALLRMTNDESRMDSPKSKSKSHCDWRSITQSISKSWCRAPYGAHDQIYITIWQLRSCFCGAPSLTRGRVCLFHMLLALASAVILVTIFYCLRFETSLFVASYDSQGHGGGIRFRLHMGYSRIKSKSKSHCDWRSVSQ